MLANSLLRQFRELGLGLSIGQFGTGALPLPYLKTLPVDQLKIDGALVRAITEDSDDAAICSGIISLAGSFGLVVVAEGVENDAQSDFLRRNGCVRMQGDHLCPVLPAEDFAAWYGQGDRRQSSVG